jgi:D-sedoheptulose 7-phosphate isomerase
MQSKHIDLLLERNPTLSVCVPAIERAFVALRESFRAKGKSLVCGNGGSAADSDHLAGELLKGFRSLRPLSAGDQAKLPYNLSSQLQGGLPMIPLTTFAALNTAVANDMSPELVYAQLVWALGQPADVFIGISTSGNARNVCAAAQVARAKGLVTIALTGQTGGVLGSLCDIAIHAPQRETYLVQECHLPIYHCLALMLEDDFFPASPTGDAE